MEHSSPPTSESASQSKPPVSALRMLYGAAALMLVIAGLKAAQSVLVPFFFALLLSMLSFPLVRQLQRCYLPRFLSIAIVVLINVAALAGFAALIGTSFDDFTRALPRYVVELDDLVDNVADRFDDIQSSPFMGQLIELGIEFDFSQINTVFNPERLVALMQGTLRGLTVVFSNVFVVILTMIFMLAEGATMPRKIEAALDTLDGEARIDRFSSISKEVQRYLLIKTAISVVTGVLAGTWVWYLGVDFPMLWALLAFLLNFIPSIGSIIASVPPMLLALITGGPGAAFVVGLGYLVINAALGNFLEPMLLGRRLGFSPLVIFLSLVFFGWLWGPAGMLLAVPLITMLKIGFEQSPQLRWLARLLDSRPPPSAEAAKPSGEDRPVPPPTELSDHEAVA